MQRPRAPGEAVIRAPPALDLSTLPQNDLQTKQLFIVQSIISQAWPALLAALSFIIATNLSDELFVEVLASYQAMANVSGMLGLTTPRDAFFNSLSKFAVPSRIISSLDSYVEPPQTPRSATAALSEGLGLGGPAQPPGLSERNMACLKVLVGCALFFAGSLGDSWYTVLETLQNADFVLVMMNKFGGGQGSKRNLFSGATGVPGGGGVLPNRSVSNPGSQSHSGNSPANVVVSKHPLLTDLDVDTMQAAIQRLFDLSKNLEDSAFRDFVNALCKLSGEMVTMQSGDGISNAPVRTSESGEDVGGSSLNVSSENVSRRRRISRIHIPKTPVHSFLFFFLSNVLHTDNFKAFRRFRYHETGKRGFAQHSSSHISITRCCLGYNNKSSPDDYPATLCSSGHSCPSCSCSRRDSANRASQHKQHRRTPSSSSTSCS